MGSTTGINQSEEKQAAGVCLESGHTATSLSPFISEALLESTNAPKLLEIKAKKCKLLCSSAVI
jgi:hypothetical protein